MYYALTVGHVFIVHTIGLFFTIRTRKIKVVVLNEYKYTLAYMVSSLVITIVIIIAFTFVIQNPTLYALFLSLLMSSVTLLFLGLTFIPKVIIIDSGEFLKLYLNIQSFHNCIVICGCPQ